MSDTNILLIVLDCVRARNTSVYNPSVQTTPELERFANYATVYEQARAPSSWSLPSHVSMFTGEPAHSHGVTATEHKLKEDETIFEELAAEGYTTGVFSDNPFLVRTDNGLVDAFHHVEEGESLRFPNAIDPKQFVFSEGEGQYRKFLKESLRHDYPLQSLWNGASLKLQPHSTWLPGMSETTLAPGNSFVEPFLSWAESQDSWAACINLMDGHAPYEPTNLVEGDKSLEKLRDQIDDYIWDFYAGDNPWWLLEAMEALYNDSIRDADAAVGNILDGLQNQGVLDDTLVVVTSDHGEAFGSPSETQPHQRVAGHGRWATEDLLHIPLIVKKPQQTETRTCTDIAPLTSFPDAVRAALSDDTIEVWTKDTAVASVQWEDEHLLGNRKHCDMPIDVLSEPSETVYKQNDQGHIVKSIRKGDETARYVIPETGCKFQVDSDGVTDYIQNTFVKTQGERLNQESVNVRGDDDVLTRLKDLGYA